MAQPKSGNSHTRGSQFIGSGLYVTGVARIAGSVNLAGALNVTGALTLGSSLQLSTHMTGIQLATGAIKDRHIGTGSAGVLFSHTLHLQPNSAPTYTGFSFKIAPVVSGQAAPGLIAMAPNVAITIRGLAFAMGTAPGGTGLRVQILSIPSSGSVVHKGYVTTKVSKIAVYKSGLSATIPAQNGYGLAINRNGSSTSSGTRLAVTVHYTRNA